MPKVYKTKKTVRRKTYKKKRVYNRKIGTAPKPMANVGLGFPTKILVKHKYFDSFDMTTSSGATATHNFCANGMYDPNLSASGHQPYYFDQYSAVYRHYSVIASKIMVNIAHSSSTNASANFCLYLNDDTTVTPALGNLMEQSKAKYTTLTANNTDVRKVSMGWSAKRTFGGAILANNNLRGSDTTNPAEQSIFSLAIWPQSLTGTQTYNVQVIIEFVAIWTELRDVAGS